MRELEDVLLDEEGLTLKDETVLDVNTPPQTLQGREKERELIIKKQKKLLRGATPPHLLLTGPNGTGKTVVIQHIMRKLNARVDDVLVAHVFGSVYNTPFAILKNVFSQLGWSAQDGESYVSNMELFRECVGEMGKNIIIVLDECDYLEKTSLNAVLYLFSRTPRVTVILIVNDDNIMGAIDDPKVMSSFLPDARIYFEPYTKEELEAILTERAKDAFYPGSLDPEVIKVIAGKSEEKGGDARFAIKALAKAADICFDELREVVVTEDALTAMAELESVYGFENLSIMTRQQRLLLKCLNQNERMRRAELLKIYNDVAENHYLTPIYKEQLSVQLSKLQRLGYIEREGKGRGRGRGVDWYVWVSSNIDRDRLEKALRK